MTDFRSRVMQSFERQGFLRELGAEIVTIEEGSLTLAAPFSDAVSQQHGLFHGAAIGALCDSAGGYSAMTVVAEDAEVLTVEYKINFVAPGRGDRLLCRGRVERAGRRLVTTSVRATVEPGDSLVAVMLQTIAVIEAGRSPQR